MIEMEVGDLVVVNGNTPVGERILVANQEDSRELWWARVIRCADNFSTARLLFTTTGIKPFFARRVQRHIRQLPERADVQSAITTIARIATIARIYNL